MDYEMGCLRLLPSGNPVRSVMQVVGAQERADLDAEAVVALNNMSASLRGVAGVLLAGSYLLTLLLPQGWSETVLDVQLIVGIDLAVGVAACAVRIILAKATERHPGHLAPPASLQGH